MKISPLFKDTVIYGLTRYLSLFAALFLTPLYTRYFEKYEYGVMDIFNTWNAFAMVIIPLGLISSIPRIFPEYQNDLENKKSAMNTIFIHLILQSVLYVVVMLLFKQYFYSIYGLSSKYDIIFNLSLLILTFQIFIDFNLTLLRVRFKKIQYLTVTVTNLILLNGLGFSFVYFLHWRIESFFIASLIAILAAFLISIYYNREFIGFKYDFELGKTIFKYAIHILSAGLLFQLSSLIDRAIISNYDTSLNAMGSYSIALRIGNLVTIISSAFALAWYPYAFSIKDNADAKQIYLKTHDTFFIIMTIFTSLLFFFRYELLLVMAPDYMETYFLIPIVSLYAFVNATMYFYTLGIHFVKKSKVISYSAVISVAINVILSLALVNFFGLYGVLIGTLVSMIVWIGIQFGYSQKYYAIKYNLSYILYFTISVLSFLLVSYFLDFYIEQYIYTISLKIIILAIVSIILYKTLNLDLKGLFKTVKQ